jgi:dinuclear metal center YbgI/SA1388 family protein
MAAIPLARLVSYCDRLLALSEYGDWDGAFNGLQVENRGHVHRLAAAVDARRATIERAAAAGADLLLVHHGLFWGGGAPWTGSRYAVIRKLIEHDLAVYSVHLPLDAHPRLGNNAQLCAALGWRRSRAFFSTKGRPIGRKVVTRLARAELMHRLAKVVGHPPLLIAAGPEVCRRIGVVSGGAGSELRQAAAEDVDTFITGEGPHWTHALAEDLGLNVFYAGHYATETLGVQALATHLSDRFHLPWTFLDYPTGL